MPDLITKIPIGFNLDGYDIINSAEQNSAPNAFSVGGTAGGIMGGVDANWEGGLVDKRWVADTSLKQVQVQTTVFQSAPLQYTADGKKYYGEVYDGIDDYSYTGTGSYTGNPTGHGCIGARLRANDINDCQSGKLSKTLQTWAESLEKSESGRKDFYCGVAIVPQTIVAYLQHFYNINVSGQQIVDVAKKKILCVEVLFNTGGTQGKAYRLKVVDSACGANSKQGTPNTVIRRMYCEYDLLDIMTAVLLLNDFSDVARVISPELNLVVNNGDLVFPWASAGYNYKKGQIPGYGPQGIAGLGLVYESKPGTQISGSFVQYRTKVHTSDGKQAVARARYFVDPENKETALSIIPNLPDEFFQTNYTDRATTYFNSLANLSNAGTMSEKIRLMAEQCSGVIANAYTANNPYYYGNGQFTALPAGNSFKYTINKYIDCDSFVDWILTELGIKQGPPGSISSRKRASQWTPGLLNQYLVSGYIATDLGTDISKAVPGDILIWGKRNSHHAAIFAGLKGSRLTEYGIGLPKYVGRGTPPDPEFVAQPHNTMGTTDLSYIIRIGQRQV